MIRRTFIKNVGLIGAAGMVNGFPFVDKVDAYKDLIIGHDTHRYKVDLNWGALNQEYYPVNDCHEMVQDSKGRIVLLTNHIKNNVIIYDRRGNLIEVWGTNYPGAHGLTINVEGGEDFLYIADNNRHEVIKTTIDGKEVQIFSLPDLKQYDQKDQFIPTETAICSNGDVYVTDGYGKQYILHYNSNGKLINIFGGPGDEEHQFNNAHGICIDTRGERETLLITARMQNKLKRFSLDGQFIESYHFPGAYICRPVIVDQHVYLATIWSGQGESGTGFVSILNAQNRMISAPGGSKPIYKDGNLEPMYQTLKLFQHPHDVCVDDEENLYVAQWNSGKTYPIKLYRV